MLLGLIFWLFSSAYALEPDASVTITSKRLDYQMIAEEAQKTTILKNRFNTLSGVEGWQGEINVYDWNNVQYMPT